MMTKEGILKLTDFGIAKDVDVTALTGANNTIGTAAYMSPEQCKGERNLTGKSDLYSLGVVFYELLTGRKPFMAESSVDMFLLHVQGTFTRPAQLNPDIPVWLDTLVCQMMEKKPEHRPRDAAMVGQVLEEIEEKVAANVESPGPTSPGPATWTRGNSATTTRRRPAAIRAGAKKKRLRKRRRPIYTRGWFVLLACLVVIGAIGGVIYYGAIAPPSAESLLQKIDAAKDPDKQKQLAAEYLNHYGTRDDEATKKVRALDRDLKVAERERVLLNRYGMKNMRANPGEGDDPDAYAKTMSALTAENAGDLAAARAAWSRTGRQVCERLRRVEGPVGLDRPEEARRPECEGRLAGGRGPPPRPRVPDGGQGPAVRRRPDRPGRHRHPAGAVPGLQPGTRALEPDRQGSGGQQGPPGRLRDGPRQGPRPGGQARPAEGRRPAGSRSSPTGWRWRRPCSPTHYRPAGRTAGTSSATSATCTRASAATSARWWRRPTSSSPPGRCDRPTPSPPITAPPRMDRSKSHAAFDRAKRLIPGGVNSPARAFGAVGGQPLFIARGEGPYLFDLDGNRYLDFIGSWGPLILGHAHPRVVEAAVEARPQRAPASAPRPSARRELAELIVEADAVDRDGPHGRRPGTEAAMSAIRLARGFTGRDVIVKFAGCYHGHVDSLLVSAGSSATDARRAQQPRRPERLHRTTPLVLRYNDVAGAAPTLSRPAATRSPA